MGSMDRIPKMGMSWRPSWKLYQRRQHCRSRYARGRLLRRGLRVGHVHTAGNGTQEIRQGPLAGHQRGRQGRPSPGAESRSEVGLAHTIDEVAEGNEVTEKRSQLEGRPQER